MKKKLTDEQYEAERARREGRTPLGEWLKAPFTEPAPFGAGWVEAVMMGIIAGLLCLVGLVCGG